MTDDIVVEEFRKKHLETYKQAVIEIITNNTNRLIQEDIFSVIDKPPLDSMDVIKQKLLNLAKKEKIILKQKELNTIVTEFRKNLNEGLLNLGDIRINSLIKVVEDFQPNRESEIINITNENLIIVNQQMKKQIKLKLKNEVTELEKEIGIIYTKEVPNEKQEKINEQFIKYMKGHYQIQILDNIAMKTMIKDTTLINGVNEQGERYLFTKANSHIFDSNNPGDFFGSVV